MKEDMVAVDALAGIVEKGGTPHTMALKEEV